MTLRETDHETAIERLGADDIKILLDLIAERLHNPPLHPVSHNIGQDALIRIRHRIRMFLDPSSSPFPTYQRRPSLDYAHDDGGHGKCDTRTVFPDTAVRAAAILTGRPYDTLFRKFTDLIAPHGYAFEPMPEEYPEPVPPPGHPSPYALRCELLRAAGLTRTALPKRPWPSFPEVHRDYGDCIVEASRTFAAIVNGTLRDLTDSRFLRNTPYFADHWHDRKAAAVWTRPATPPLLAADRHTSDDPQPDR